MKYRQIRINLNTVGMTLLIAYIFFAYNAVDIVIPSVIKSLTLYAFIAYGAFLFIYDAKELSIPIYTIWYLIFIVFSIMIMLYSPNRELLSGTLYLMIVSLIMTWNFQKMIKNQKQFEKIAWVFSISSFCLIFTLLITGNLVGDSSNRLGEKIMGNANTFAVYIMIAVLLQLWILIYSKDNLTKKVLMLVMIVANMYALILSGGRKFFIVPFLFAYILLLFKRDKNGRSHLIKYTIVVAVFSVIAFYSIMNIPVFYNAIGIRMEAFLNGILGTGDQDSSSMVRDLIRKLALEKWLEKPFFGYGFDSFKYYAVTEVGQFFYSHCNYTELLYNGGIFYFLLYYSIYFKILYDTLYKKTGTIAVRAFACAICICLFVFEVACVTYELLPVQLMLALSLRGLSLEEDT